jgi:hypothetical protein
MLVFTHSIHGGPSLFRIFIALLATAALAAQQPSLPRVGIIEIYGNHKVSSEKIRKAIGIEAGATIPASKGDLEEKIEQVPDVIRANVEAICCDQGKAILFVGVDERGFQPPEFHEWPLKEVELPPVIVDVYALFTAALDRAVRAGDTAEDLTQGYSLMKNTECRIQQQRMAGLAELHAAALHDVLRNATDPAQRAIAAYITGYGPDKAAAAADLQYALQDPDDAVRANSARALKALAIYAHANPESGVKVNSTWFVELLNSIIVSDRVESAKTLLVLTEKPDPQTMANLQERGKDPLIEMSRWQYLPDALPGYLLLGRISGWSDADLEAQWSKGDRDKVIDQITHPPKKK